MNDRERPQDTEGVLAQFARLTLERSEDVESRLRLLEKPNGHLRLSSAAVQWGVSLLISGLLAWGVAQSKQAVFDTQINYVLERLNRLEADVRDLTRQVDRLHADDRRAQ